MIALATTLPRQIEMTHDLHSFTTGWNELLASWARLGGVADNMHPEADANFDPRMKFDRLVLREGEQRHMRRLARRRHGLILAQPTGRINVRGTNGSGKSTLLTSLKSR